MDTGFSASLASLVFRERSASRQIRATTVVSHPVRFSTAAVSERLNLNHAS
jgi:hypothetical protein